jgi:hypothetical protein
LAPYRVHPEPVEETDPESDEKICVDDLGMSASSCYELVRDVRVTAIY